MNFQAVRPAVILRDQIAVLPGREPEDAAEGDVDEIEIAGAIERRAFDEAVDLLAQPVGIGPVAALPVAELVRQTEMQLGGDALGRLKEIHADPLTDREERSHEGRASSSRGAKRRGDAVDGGGAIWHDRAPIGA